jgi:SAM-dependent methyltransferase
VALTQERWAVGPEPSNAQQAEYWNEVAGPRWVDLQERLDAQLGPLGEAMLVRATLAPGDRVLDVGCGCGASSLQAAERVAPGGSVVGLDLSAPMLRRARERASAAGVASLVFERADVQTRAFSSGSAEVVISRFGVMFFASPEAAFTRLRDALVPDGRLSFVCWQALDRNAWMSAPLAAVAQLLPLPAPREPGAPGPFAFADPDRVRAILAAAGFESISVEGLEGELSLGGARTAEEAGAFLLEVGPASHALRDAGADEALRRRAAEVVAEALVPYAGEGSVRAPFAAWIVTARSPR